MVSINLRLTLVILLLLIVVILLAQPAATIRIKKYRRLNREAAGRVTGEVLSEWATK